MSDTPSPSPGHTAAVSAIHSIVPDGGDAAPEQLSSWPDHLAQKSSSGTMKPVYISYRREDASKVADFLFEKLTAKYGPRAVVIDFDRALSNSEKKAKIEAAIRESSVLIALIGRRWLDCINEKEVEAQIDHRVVFELATAVRANITIIPLLVDGAAPPSFEQIPAEIKFISSLHQINFGSDEESGFAEVTRTLSNFDVGPPEEAYSPRPKPEPRPLGSKVFISYRRDDTRHLAGRLFDRLATEFSEHDIFFDTASIPIAVSFVDSMKSAMSESAVLLALIGTQWVNKSWQRSWLSRLYGRPPVDNVQLEIEMAFELGLPVLPILIDEMKMPSTKVLPGTIAELHYLNATPLRSGRDFHDDCDRILETIRPWVKAGRSLRR